MAHWRKPFCLSSAVFVCVCVWRCTFCLTLIAALRLFECSSLSVYLLLSLFLSACMSFFLSLYLLLCLSLFVCLSLCLCICFSLSLPPFLCLSVSSLSLSLPVRLCDFESVSICLLRSVSLRLYLVCLFLPVCLSAVTLCLHTPSDCSIFYICFSLSDCLSVCLPACLPASLTLSLSHRWDGVHTAERVGRTGDGAVGTWWTGSYYDSNYRPLCVSHLSRFPPGSHKSLPVQRASVQRVREHTHSRVFFHWRWFSDYARAGRENESSATEIRKVHGLTTIGTLFWGGRVNYFFFFFFYRETAWSIVLCARKHTKHCFVCRDIV